MPIYYPPDDSLPINDPTTAYGTANIKAVDPLAYDEESGTLSIGYAGTNAIGIVSALAQNFSGTKNLSGLKVGGSSEITGFSTDGLFQTPTDTNISSQLATKTYIDNTKYSNVSWQQPVKEFYDASVSLPLSPLNGDRVICSDSGNGWIKNYIYTYIVSSWSGIIPVEGYTVYVDGEDSTWTYNGSAWVHIGISIDHVDLQNKGTLTHSTIDSYLNQSVKDTASPNFAAVRLWNAITTNYADMFYDGTNLDTRAFAAIRSRMLSVYDSAKNFSGYIAVDPANANIIVSSDYVTGKVSLTGDVLCSKNITIGSTSTSIVTGSINLINGLSAQTISLDAATDKINFDDTQFNISPTCNGITFFKPTKTYASSIAISSSTGDLTIATQDNDINLNVVGKVNVSNNLNVIGAALSTSTSTGALVVGGGVGVADSLYIGGRTRCTNVEDVATAFTDTSTGSLIVSGGASVALKVRIKDTSVSSSTTTGALQVAGGVGMGSMYCGGTATIASAIKFDADTSSISSKITNSGGITIFGSTTAVNGASISVCGNSQTNYEACVRIIALKVNTKTQSGVIMLESGAGVPSLTITYDKTVKIFSTADASDATTGALQVVGGASMNSLFVGTGGIAMTSAVMNFQGNAMALKMSNTSQVTGYLGLYGGVSASTGGAVTLYNSAAASRAGSVRLTANVTGTEPQTGQVLIEVGVGGQALLVESDKSVNITGNTTDAASTSTGALRVSAGVGIGKNLYVGTSVTAASYLLHTPTWDDLNLIGLARTTGANVPSFNQIGTSGTYAYSFSATATKEIFASAQTSHSHNRFLQPHIHLTGGFSTVDPANNASVWNLIIRFYKANNQTDAYTYTDTKTFTILANNAAWSGNQIQSFSQIDLTNLNGISWGVSVCMAICLQRLGGDPADTFADELTLTAFDLHWDIARYGSTNSDGS